MKALLFAVAVSLAGCGSGVAIGESEPNDTEAAAEYHGVLTYDQSWAFSGRVGDPGDPADFLAFDADDSEGTHISTDLVLTYVVEDLSEVRLRVFYLGAEMSVAEDFHVDPTEFAGAVATIRANAGGLGWIGSGRLSFAVEAVSGAASWSLTFATERE